MTPKRSLQAGKAPASMGFWEYLTVYFIVTLALLAFFFLVFICCLLFKIHLLSTVYKFFQAIAWLATAAAVCFGVYKHFSDARTTLKWEKAKLAKSLMDDLSANAKAMDACYMLGGFENRRYERQVKGETVEFRLQPNQPKLGNTRKLGTGDALSLILDLDRDQDRKQPPDDNAWYVRECFDELFWHLDRCVAAADSGIVDWEVLQPMFLNLFAGMEESTILVLKKYALRLRYERAAEKIKELVQHTGA